MKLPELLAIGVWLIATEAGACPKCQTAQTVRAWVFDDRFWSTVGLIALPLLVMAIALFSVFPFLVADGRGRTTRRRI
jgi:hypothetical protein